MSDEHHRRLEQMYHSAPCNQDPPPRLHVKRGEATVELDAEANMHHAAGAVHGAWLFKLMDDAAFFAANSLVETFVLTVHFDVHLLAPATTGRLEAQARVVHEGRSSMLAEAVVRDEHGDQLARGTGSFVKSKQPLDELDGYAGVLEQG